MRAKSSTGAVITETRPNFVTGNYGVTAEVPQVNTFRELINSKALTPIGTNTWNDIQNDISTGNTVSSSLRKALKCDVNGVISLYSEDLIAGTTINVNLGVTESTQLDCVRQHGNKAEFFEALSKGKVNLPFWAATADGLNGIRHIVETNTALPSEVFVKPCSGNGSVGVYKGDTSDKEKFLEQLKIDFAGMSTASNLLIMESIGSTMGTSEIAVNAIIRKSKVVFICIHDKLSQSFEPPFRDFILSTPSKYDSYKHEHVEVLVDKIVKSTKITDSVLQLEIRISNTGQLIPIDSALRPDGGLIPESIFKSYEIDIKLVHTYFQLQMFDEVDRLLRSVKNQSTATSTSIGAFYADDSVIVSSGLSLLERLSLAAKLQSKIPMHVKAEFSTTGIITQEFAISFCTEGNNREESLALIKDYCHILGINEGKSFI